MRDIKNLFLPNKTIQKTTFLTLCAIQIVVAILVWSFSASQVIPGPGGAKGLAQVQGPAAEEEEKPEDATEAAPSIPNKPKDNRPDLAVMRRGRREFTGDFGLDLLKEHYQSAHR